MPAAAATLLEAIDAYLNAFNARDEAGIVAALHPDVTVKLHGAVAATGRDVILPSYHSDWAAGKTVGVVKGPTTDGDLAKGTAAVTLEAITPPAAGTGGSEQRQQVSVVYHYEGGVQVVHDIVSVA